jgi:exodeoxyribonuclease VII small subunit
MGKFEGKLKELKATISKMEDPDTELDESIALYEKGKKLMKEANDFLLEIEERVKNMEDK